MDITGRSVSVNHFRDFKVYEERYWEVLPDSTPNSTATGKQEGELILIPRE